LRRQGDVSQQQLTREAERFVDFLGRIEPGFNVSSFETLNKLAAALQVEANKLSILDSRASFISCGSYCHPPKRKPMNLTTGEKLAKMAAQQKKVGSNVYLIFTSP